MDFLPENIQQYALVHSDAEPSLLAELRRETHQKVLNPRMLSGHYQGRLLSMLSQLIRPHCILEIGTYTGYSALCMAEGLAEEGVLHTIDINEELDWLHDRYFMRAGMQHKIISHYGDATELIPNLGLKNVDLVFIDADKENYSAYYDLCLPLMRPGGLILIDNVLWSGKVLQPALPGDTETSTLQELNARITRDPRVDKLLLPIRDGLYVLRVREGFV